MVAIMVIAALARNIMSMAILIRDTTAMAALSITAMAISEGHGTSGHCSYGVHGVKVFMAGVA